MEYVIVVVQVLLVIFICSLALAFVGFVFSVVMYFLLIVFAVMVLIKLSGYSSR